MAYTTINKPTDYFNTKLYTGNGSTQSITGVGFQPDFTWIKSRTTGGSGNNNHCINDVVRTKGTYGYPMIHPNLTASEYDPASGNEVITDFQSDGFDLGGSENSNYNTATYASWNWKANGAGSANTDGSINTTSTSVNTTAGFSISKYTGTGSAGATVGHGLGVAPKMIIAKGLTYADVWIVGGDNLGGWNKEMYLNSISAVATNNNAFNGVAPTSSVFTLGSGNGTNKSGDTYIAYCFAEKQGYSKFGSYVGNGNADGTFVYTGFKPAFVMAKASSATGYWTMHDNKRTNSFNVVDGNLYAQITSSEDTGANAHMDFLSNGFKLRGNYAAQNGSGTTNIFMAFAEAPLVGTNNVPCTAR